MKVGDQFIDKYDPSRMVEILEVIPPGKFDSDMPNQKTINIQAAKTEMFMKLVNEFEALIKYKFINVPPNYEAETKNSLGFYIPEGDFYDIYKKHKGE